MVIKRRNLAGPSQKRTGVVVEAFLFRLGAREIHTYLKRMGQFP
jgi:hypothetical protein